MGCVCVVIGYSITLISQHPHRNFNDYKLFDHLQTGMFLGVACYAFKSISIVINVRRTMKDRTKMPKLSLMVMFLASIIYFVTGLLVYLAHGDDNVFDVVFKYYEGDGALMSHLGKIYLLTNFFGIPCVVYSTIEPLEALSSTRWMLLGKNGELDVKRITFFRVGILFLSVGVTFISDNFIKVMDFSGSFCIPIMGYFIPVILYWEYCK